MGLKTFIKVSIGNYLLMADWTIWKNPDFVHLVGIMVDWIYQKLPLVLTWLVGLICSINVSMTIVFCWRVFELKVIGFVTETTIVCAQIYQKCFFLYHFDMRIQVSQYLLAWMLPSRSQSSTFYLRRTARIQNCRLHFLPRNPDFLKMPDFAIILIYLDTENHIYPQILAWHLPWRSESADSGCWSLKRLKITDFSRCVGIPSVQKWQKLLL